MDIHKLRAMGKTKVRALSHASRMAKPKSSITMPSLPTSMQPPKKKEPMKPGRGSEVIKYGLHKNSTEAAEPKKVAIPKSGTKPYKALVNKMRKAAGMKQKRSNWREDIDGKTMDEISLGGLGKRYAKAHPKSVSDLKMRGAGAELRGDQKEKDRVLKKLANRKAGANMYTMKALGDYSKVKMKKEDVDKVVEGYEAKVSKILNKKGIDHTWKNGKVYVAKRDLKAAEKKLKKKAGPGLGTAVRMIPQIVGEGVTFDLHVDGMMSQVIKEFKDVRNIREGTDFPDSRHLMISRYNAGPGKTAVQMTNKSPAFDKGKYINFPSADLPKVIESLMALMKDNKKEGYK